MQLDDGTVRLSLQRQLTDGAEIIGLLGRRQDQGPLVALGGKKALRPGNVIHTKEEVQIRELSEGEVTVGQDSQAGPFVRDGVDVVLVKQLQQTMQFTGQEEVADSMVAQLIFEV